MHIWAVGFPSLREDRVSSFYKLRAGSSRCPTWCGGGTGCGRVQGHPAAQPTCQRDGAVCPQGCTLAWAGVLPGDTGAAGRAGGKQGPQAIPGGDIEMGEMVGVLEKDFRNWGWSSIFPASAATSGCGSLIHVPNPCPVVALKVCPVKKVKTGEGGAQKPQPSKSEPTHGAARRLAPSCGEAAQLGLGWFPGQAGHFLKHFQHFQHFLKGTAMSGAGPSWVTARDARQGGAGTALSEYH